MCRVQHKAALQRQDPIAKTSGDASQPAATGIAFARGRALTAFLAIRFMEHTVPMAASLIGVVIPTVAGAIVAKDGGGVWSTAVQKHRRVAISVGILVTAKRCSL